MKASDIAKLAAGIAAGSITYGAAKSQLESDGDLSLLDNLLAAGAGAVAGAAVSKVMDATGVSGLVDDVADTVSDIFDF